MDMFVTLCRALDRDRIMSTDIEAAVTLLKEEQVRLPHLTYLIAQLAA